MRVIRTLVMLVAVLGLTLSCDGTASLDPAVFGPGALGPGTVVPGGGAGAVAPPTAIVVDSVEITEITAVSGSVVLGGGATLAPNQTTAVTAGESASLAVGALVGMSVVALDVDGNEIEGVRFAWESDNEDVVSINSRTGLSTGESAGQAGITVSGDGVTSGEFRLNVTARGIPSLVELSATPVNSEGQAEIGVFGTATVTAFVTDQPVDPAADRGDPVPSVRVDFTVFDATFGAITVTAQTNAAGIALGTFVAANRGGTAIVTARAGTVNSSVSIEVISADPVALQFVSAEPQVIGIKGAGQQETAVVRFLVADTNGNPAGDGLKVCFELRGPGGVSADLGGATISPTEASTAGFGTPAAGQVQTTLQSGTVPGPARILATVSDTDFCTPLTGTIRTESSPVSIGGGVPDLAHFTVASSRVNIAGFLDNPRASGTVGVTSEISVFMADQFGNFNVLEGTSVSFIIEAGSIDRSNILAADGTTTVTLRTQSPPPIDRGLGADVSTPFSTPPTTPCNISTGTGCNAEDGLVTYVALAKGQECFNDKNGDGLFTEAIGAQDEFDFVTRRTCDIGEPFINANDSVYLVGDTFPTTVNGVLTTVTVVGGDGVEGTAKFDPDEIFIDVNQNGIWDGANGQWDGVEADTTIWKAGRITFSGQPWQLEVVDPATDVAVLPFCLNPGEFQNMLVRVSDNNDANGDLSPPLGNAPGGGTTIEITTTAGELANAGPFLLPDVALGPYEAAFSIANALEILPNTSQVLAQAASISVIVNYNPGGGAAPGIFGPVIIAGTLEGTDPLDCP